MTQVGTAVAVLKQPVTTKGVVVRTIGGGADREGDVEHRRLEDALLGEERDPPTFVLEAGYEERPRQDVTVQPDLALEPAERSRAYSRIMDSVDQPELLRLSARDAA
jgi:hypothetical protein